MQKFKKHDDAISKFTDYLKTSDIYQYINEIILFGSVARNEERSSSDLDVMIILNNNFDFEEHRKIIREITVIGRSMEIFDVEIDAHFEKQYEFDHSMSLFYKAIKKTGVVLYEKPQL